MTTPGEELQVAPGDAHLFQRQVRTMTRTIEVRRDHLDDLVNASVSASRFASGTWAFLSMAFSAWLALATLASTSNARIVVACAAVSTTVAAIVLGLVAFQKRQEALRCRERIDEGTIVIEERFQRLPRKP